MPKSATSNSNDGHSNQPIRYPTNWPVVVLCALSFCFILAALIDYDPVQVGSPFRATSASATNKNWAGWIGADVIWVLLYSFGFAIWLIPVLIGRAFYMAIWSSRRLTAGRVIAMGIAVVLLASLAAMFHNAKWASDYFPCGPGGYVGRSIYHGLLADATGGLFSGIMLATLYACALVYIFTRDIRDEFQKIYAMIHAWRDKKRELKTAAKAAQVEAAKIEKEESKKAAAAAAVAAANQPPPPKKEKETTPPVPVGPVGPTGKKVFVPKTAEDPLAAKPAARVTEPPMTPPATSTPEAPTTEPKAEAKPAVPKRPAPAPVAETATDTKSLEANATGKLELNIVKPEELKKAKAIVPQSTDDNYQFPPITILKEQVRPSAANSELEHRTNAENLLRILGEFGVEVTLGEIHVGPVITRYEVVPAAGVRVEKIAGLDKNIALGMRAQSVRILAPIPGKAAVGVEVPNHNPTPVGMREIVESEDWASAKAELPIALGKDVSGKPLISDLSKMPHLLIAGATGSGKSVCINSIVASILYSKSPRDVRLIMVDPKVVELKIFNTLPHMLIPVVTEAKKVPGALKWLLSEMEQRYQIFAKCNVRNIVGFNGRKKTAEPPPADPQGALTGVDPLADDGIEVPDRLPYIVAIIDELADLMMVAPAEIETSIARLAQLARAAGIHLIIATQRPSVNVITGVIKANLPSRIAFQVASQVDSRTILDTKGADTLIGRGDMLFSPPGTSRLVRAQGAFVSDEEVIEVVEFMKKNGPPQYAQTVQQQIDRAASEDEEGEEGGGDDDLGDDEDLYNQALDVLKSTRRASTSMIQRRLRIGYNRAARIMDLMEEKGIVGPENGSSPREILVDLDSL